MISRPSILTTLAAAVLALLPLGAPARASQSPRPIDTRAVGRLAPLPGSMLPHLDAARRLSPLPADTELPLTIGLKVRDAAGLQQLINHIYTPGSPQYHRFLTPDQFAARFAATRDDQQRAVDWLQSKGLRVVQRPRNGLIIDAVGTAARVQTAFNTRLYSYRRGSESFFANAGPAEIPLGLTPVVGAVTGLNTASRLRSLAVRHAAAPRISGRLSGLSPLSPADLGDFYNFKSLWQQGLDGSGQTIAIVGFTDVSDGNIATFDSRFGLPAPDLVRVPVSNGAATGGSSIDRNEQTESELDIEVAHSMAPGARLLLYAGPDTSSGVDVWNQIVSEDRAQVISSSYGAAETELDPGFIDAIDQIAEEAAAQGQSVLSAAGDDGAFDAARIKVSTHKKDLEVDFPASDPWVTGVGGTMVQQAADGSFTEVPWSDHARARGGGGGLSILFKRPSYQSGPGVDNQYSDGKRQVPDVSALAGLPAYAIYTYLDGGNDWHGIGGTSAATPLWASYAALIDQRTQGPIGFLNPTLYALGQKSAGFQNPPFTDITSGDNLYYPATAGWDFASGWGPMDGQHFLDDIAAMGGAPTVRPVDVALKAEVDRYSNGKYTRLTLIKRGQTIRLRLLYEVIALPGPATMVHDYSLASGQYTLAHRTDSVQLDKSFVGQWKERWQQVKVPKNAPSGVYILTVKTAIGDVSAEATALVTLK